MIISRTPYRISFFGGGTDYPAWYRQHGGAVLATTIDKFCYLMVRYFPPFFEHRYRVVWSRMENTATKEDITHPAVRAILDHLQIDRGVGIQHDGDLPARGGMGSSSAFTVGLLHALYALKGQIATKHQLALESIHIEQEVLKETVGSQDQVLAAHGGFNHISFLQNGDVVLKPMTLPPDRIQELNAHLMLFYSGIRRTAAKVAKTYVQDIEAKEKQLRLLAGMVDEAIGILNGSGELDGFGKLLHEGWKAKRSLSSKVSNSEVEKIYEAARSAGALGGKLTGAGGGGFMLLFAAPRTHSRIREALKGLIHVPFKFEYSGSQIIFYDVEVDYSAEDRARNHQSIRAFKELGS
ncbi:MAG: kinase [Nitrospirae bacterium]|nr:kinase [Nitrospirota bacterium]